MRTFVEKPKTLQPTTSTKTSAVSRAHLGQHHYPNPILNLQHTVGNEAVLRLLQSNAAERNAVLTNGALQTKLAINKPEDEYEQEADHVADHVMRMSDQQLQGAGPFDGACSKSETKKEDHVDKHLQTKNVQASDGGNSAVSPIVREALRSPGQPLDSATLAFIEPRLGYDFSHVRVHTDPTAVESARVVNALAFTTGRDIVFGDSQYSPHTEKGRRLLTHELVHVVQQASEARLRTTRLPASHNGNDILHDDNIGYVQREAGPRSPIEAEQSRQEGILSTDAFDLCVAARALGFIPDVTQAVVERTLRAMQAAILHHVPTLSEFVEVVEEYSPNLQRADQAGRERFIEYHRHRLVNLGISGQTLDDEVAGGARIVIVGSPGLISTREFVERHERAHAGLSSLDVKTPYHHEILGDIGLGEDRIPHLGTRIRL